ncbi:MAG: isochorismatase (2,3 dihydro-2,3 dihydroxybenzoate synthase)-like protein [Betaproteobacteria bacterium]|nr:isochorismatase (2,3 dihydro-2,3 dihydroxybenzoate synthase)-like protein [Betaproteobacteria bacterium]
MAGPVLLLVDYMNPLDFPGSEKLAPAALRAARNTRLLRMKLKGRRVPCVFANDNFGRWQSQFDNVVDWCRSKGAASAEIARLLEPERGDISILKPRHSAFYGTPLHFLLEDLKPGYLIVAGVAAESCITFTALDAYLRRYKLWIPEDCVAAESAVLKRRALEHLARVTKASTLASTTPLSRIEAELRAVKP